MENMSQIDKFKEECLKIVWGTKLNSQTRYLITHYTSPEGFKGIVESGKLWATRYDCLNDISERNDLITIYNQAVEELCSTDEFFIKFKGLKLDGRYYSSSKAEKTDITHIDIIKDPEIFVISFSNDDDSLSMWNYYSKNNKYEGYALSFIKNDNEYYNSEPNLNIQCFDLIYDKTEKKKYLIDVLQKIKSIFVDTEECLEFAKGMLGNLFFVWNDKFKNKHFEHEKEHRIMIVQSKSNRTYQVQTRINKGLIIPYIEFPIDKFLELYSVKCAPLHNDDKAVKLTKEYLESFDSYKNVKVEKSTIPIRY